MTGICKKFICFILFATLIVTSLVGGALDNEENAIPVAVDPINENNEISAVGDTVKIPVQVVSGFHYGDKKAGESIVPIKDAAWCGGYFKGMDCLPYRMCAPRAPL